MECRDILVKLREDKGLSQQELADRLFVTRQAVSRWERGEAVPSSDLLKDKHHPGQSPPADLPKLWNAADG